MSDRTDIQYYEHSCFRANIVVGQFKVVILYERIRMTHSRETKNKGAREQKLQKINGDQYYRAKVW